MNPSVNRNSIIFTVAAFLVGILGTLLVTNILRGSAVSQTAAKPAQESSAESEQGGEAGHEENGKDAGAVRLSPEGAKTVGVRVEPVTYQSLRESLNVPATVEASQSGVAKITPPVAGKVVRVLVRLGDSVTAGQPLAVLDSFEVAQAHAAERQAEGQVRQAQAAVQTARAEVGQARGRQSSAENAVATQSELAKAGAFSQAPLQAAQAELSDAQSELLSAQTERQSHEVVYQRTERLFKEGIVSRAELEASQLERAQDQTRVDRLQARVDITKQTLAREKRVASAGLLNRQAVQTAQAEVRAAAGEVTRARRLLDAAQTSLTGAREALSAATANLAALEGAGGHAEGEGGRVVLFAPIAGAVSEVDATLGETVERSSTLFQIENLGAVIVQANVPEKDISRVRIGLRVEVTVAAFPNERFTGVVQSLASRVSEKTRALPVRCLVSNPARRLRPEMFATVALPVGDSRSVLTIPESAVVTARGEGEKETTVVFVAAREAGEYEKRTVIVGGTFGGRVQITGGLTQKDRVVVSGAYTLLSETIKGELAEE